MAEKYIIGVDGGSQTTKVVIFDLKGNVVCEGKKELKAMHRPAPGVVEHPDDDLWTSLIDASREAISKFPGDKKDIIALGLCTIRYCRVLLKKDGTLAQNVISWMDIRVSSPYRHTNPDVGYVTTTTGYITHRLTGNFKDMSSNCQGEWPIDTDTWEWSESAEVFKHYNIPRDMLFDLYPPGAVLGHVTPAAAELTGIPQGLPVVATGNDKAVEALGAGLNNDPLTGLLTMGTYIACMVPGAGNPKDSKEFWTNFACIPHVYLHESYGVRRGMWTVSWWRDILGEEAQSKARKLGISTEDYLNRIAEKVPAGSEGLMTVPEFLAPPAAPYKKGIMIGFDARHTAAHIYRSIFEAIALTMKNKTDAMCKELGIRLKELIVSGGGSNSDLFMQIAADVYGIPSRRTVVNSSAGLGSAICAAVAMGIYPGFEQAMGNMVRRRDRFEPNPENHALYNLMNEEVYKHITTYTDPVCEKSYPIFN